MGGEWVKLSLNILWAHSWRPITCYALGYHGFFGRWRDADPQIQEQERLKKIKEDEEKEAERLKEEQEAKGRVETEEVSLDDKSNLW
jgi:hypothetical protein